MTPFLLVDADIEGVEVPEQHVRDGKIILNIAPGAVQEITFEDEWIYFSARFSGRAFIINVPINAVLAIYAKENGRGMVFAGDESLAENDTKVEEKESGNTGIRSIQTKEQETRKKPVFPATSPAAVHDSSRWRPPSKRNPPWQPCQIRLPFHDHASKAWIRGERRVRSRVTPSARQR